MVAAHRIVDQALLGVVAAKHFFVRLYALAGKVVVLDEIPSYDHYTGSLVDTLITELEALGLVKLSYGEIEIIDAAALRTLGAM